MPYFIAGDCLDVLDKSCVEECPVDCIYQGDRKMYINPRECIDCGACEPVCPVSAINSDLRLDADETTWQQDNAAFFDQILPGRDAALGAPGGAGSLGPVGVDTPLAAGTLSNAG
ncbi:MAG TPA: ferredoxin [Pseudonocardiaceae bacterium]|jgi:NAD-dependent dihydropyrimidine dehydrogenase PreA subunit|nr:ferredoxin [Pseudonocardiaceae bacterium]